MIEQPEGAFLSPVLSIEESWVDYNGHLNQAYYSALFDRGIDEALIPAGLGAEYVKTREASYMTVECHVCFIRELFKTDKVRVAARVLDVDAKRLHMYCELLHSEEGWLSATSEWMFLHIDMKARRTAPWPDDVRVKLDKMQRAVGHLPKPDRAGRSIAIPRSKS